MVKFDPYSRRALRRHRKAWLRNNFVAVTGVILGVVVLLAMASAIVITAASGPVRWYALGALHVGLMAAAVHLLHATFLAHDQEAIWHLRGAWGEDNTRSELQRAKRRRLIWGWVDSINLRVGDLDHVVVTRRGGVAAIDSKWRSQVSRDDTIEMARAALKAKSRAEGLARTLLKTERGARHRARVQPLTVHPVVVLWGAAQRSVPHGAVVEGVRFLAGRQLVPWLRQLDGDAVSKEAARDVLQRLTTYRAGAWRDV